MSRTTALTLVSSLVALIIGWLVAEIYSPAIGLVAGLTVFCIVLWAIAVVPEYWPALVFFLAALVFEMAPREIIFSGFYSSTFWLAFSSIVLGSAIRHTGLGQRLAVILSSVLGNRYPRVIFVLVMASMLLAFVMPSAMGRVLLLVPIVAELADRMGYAKESNGRTGMLLAAVFGTFLPAFAILPANAPNVILAGMAESLYGYQISYWDYLLMHFPVLGLLKACLLVGLICWWLPAPPIQPKVQQTRVQQTRVPRMDRVGLSAAEWRLLAVLVLCLIGWLTDRIHGFSPGWVGLAAALYCLWPGAKLTAKDSLNQTVPLGSLLFIAALIGLGALISEAGLGELLVLGLTNHVGFAPDQPLANLIQLVWVASLVAVATNLPGVPTLMMPMAEDLSQLAGVSLTGLLMIQVFAFSNVFLPYQAPPLLIAARIASLSMARLSAVCLIMFVLGLFVLMPLELLWWLWLFN